MSLLSNAALIWLNVGIKVFLNSQNNLFLTFNLSLALNWVEFWRNTVVCFLSLPYWLFLVISAFYEFFSRLDSFQMKIENMFISLPKVNISATHCSGLTKAFHVYSNLFFHSCFILQLLSICKERCILPL